MAIGTITITTISEAITTAAKFPLFTRTTTMGKEQLAKEATTINMMEIWLLELWVRCSVVT